MSSPRKHGCPAPELIDRVARGAASGDEERAVIGHLDTCDGCRERFDQVLDPTEEFAACRPDATARAAADWRALSDSGRFSAPRIEMQDGAAVLGGYLRLQPTDRSGALGKLGDYDIMSILGQGGMGIVLKGFHATLERPVALKVLGPALSHDEAARQRFLREAKSAAQLKHPHVVTVHSVGTYDAYPYIDMEYVAGRPLSVVLAEEDRLEPARAIRIARQILMALDHAHGRGIVHRDVKPANVMLEEEDETVKLADFGLARGVADVMRPTGEGTILGTPSYMSPEQASAAPDLDGRSDLFAVGIVLYETLIGALPFTGNGAAEIIRHIREAPLPDPCRQNATVPQPLGEIVRRALQKDPDQRFASAGDFVAALDRFHGPGATGRDHTVAAAGSPAKTTCGVCDKEFVSKFSIQGACEVCREPICTACWNRKKQRRCARHAAVEGPSETRPAPGARTAVPPLPTRPVPPTQPTRKAEAPGTRLPTPGRRQVDSEETVAERIAAARNEGRPALSSGEARIAEATFFRLVENRLETVRELTDPCRRAAIRISNWLTVPRREQSLLAPPRPRTPRRSAAGRDEDLPTGAGVLYEPEQRGLGRQSAQVTIAVQSLARAARFAEQGFDDEPYPRSDLELLLNDVARQAREQDRWYAVILFSPTGWREEGVEFVQGASAHGFRDRLVSPVLFDADARQFLFSPTDEKLLPLHEAFAVEMDGAMLERARSFLAHYFELHDSLAIEALVDELRISHKAAVQIGKALSLAGEYQLETVDEIGMVLSRRSSEMK